MKLTGILILGAIALFGYSVYAQSEPGTCPMQSCQCKCDKQCDKQGDCKKCCDQQGGCKKCNGGSCPKK